MDPARRPGESIDQQEERLARSIQALVEKDRRAFELEQKLKDRDKRDEERNKDALFRAVSEGKTYEDITKAIVSGEMAPPTREQVALTEQEKRVQALEEKLRSYEERDQRSQHEAQFKAQVQTVSEKLKASADRHPLISALDWAPGTAVQRHQQASQRGEQVDLDGVLSSLEEAATRDVRSILTSDSAVAALLRDPDIKNRLAKHFGGAEQREPSPASRTQGSARGNGPSVIPPSIASEPGARVKASPPSADERRTRAAAALRAQRERRV